MEARPSVAGDTDSSAPLPPIPTARQLADFLQTTEAALAQDRYRGRGIPYVKIGGRVRYLREDVLAYLTANRIGGDAA